MIPSAHYKYEMFPPPAPITSVHVVPGANFSVRSAHGMDGMRQMLHKAFISPRRLRTRRVNLLLLGPLPQAPGETVNWARQEE